MSDIFSIETLEWRLTRPDTADGVFTKTLFSNSCIKMALTCVKPGGSFKSHKDSYGHLFYFLSGEGTLSVFDKQYRISPGLVVHINAGEPHAYTNISKQDLILISANIGN
jgi:quercetin dioxygenase-like cupin family protein